MISYISQVFSFDEDESLELEEPVPPTMRSPTSAMFQVQDRAVEVTLEEPEPEPITVRFVNVA